jgi:hypothetical protein
VTVFDMDVSASKKCGFDINKFNFAARVKLNTPPPPN